MKPDRNISDPQLAKALAHPLRVSILAELEERTASPSELAGKLDASLGLVSYHVRALARLGLVSLVETRPRRGALEHYYRAEERPLITSEAWAKVPSIVKQATIRATLTQIAGHVNGAAQSGGFERSSAHLSRSPVVVDKRGWDELATKFDRLLSDIERIGVASAKRLAASDHAEETRAIGVLMLFEAAPAESKKPAAPRRRGRSTRDSEVLR
ncbi:MAG: winged helix-turn-helix domain-containing protein [Actinomycetota bacterium]|nr:winged helix-turn-helix domain-containing protein [Actinomycetota bacterium]